MIPGLIAAISDIIPMKRNSDENYNKNAGTLLPKLTEPATL